MQVPSAYACPITGYCMLDPVMAADGNTYERVAIQQWLLHQRTSPMTRAALDFTDLYPNHEKKADIDVWRKSQQPGQLHAKSKPKTNRPLYKLTWATTPGQAIDELNNLILSVNIGGCDLTKSQLNRIRGCLSRDPQVWMPKTQRKFQALEAECLRSATSSNSRDSEVAWLSNLSSEDSDEVLQPFGSCLSDQIQSATDSDVTQAVPRSNQMQFDVHNQLDSNQTPAKLLHDSNQPLAQCLQTPWCHSHGQKMFDLTPPRADTAAGVSVTAAVPARVALDLATDDTEDFHECRDFLVTERNTDIQMSVASHLGPIELCEPTNYEFPPSSSMTHLEATTGDGYIGFALDEAACATTVSESVTKQASRDTASATAVSLKKQPFPEFGALCADTGWEPSGRQDDPNNRILNDSPPFFSPMIILNDSFPPLSLPKSQSEATFETLESSYGDDGARVPLDSNSRRPKRMLESDGIESTTKLKHSKSVGDWHSAPDDYFNIADSYYNSLFS